MYLERQVSYFLGNFTPKTSNYCLKDRALGFPGMWVETDLQSFDENVSSFLPGVSQKIPLCLSKGGVDQKTRHLFFEVSGSAKTPSN